MNWRKFNPVAWLDALVTANVRYSQRIDRTLVDRGPFGFKRLLAGFGLRLVCTVLATFTAGGLLGEWPATVGFLALSIIGGMWAALALGKPLAYRNGWLDGRRQFVEEFSNYDNFPDMMNAQLTRDEWVLGIIRMPQSPEGLE